MAYVTKVTAGGNTEMPVASSLYGTCSTTAGTAVKVVTCAEFDTLVEGVTIAVKFTNGNTNSAPKMNVNGTGSKNIYYDGNGFIDNIGAGVVVLFTYDGYVWNMIGHWNDRYVQQIYIDPSTSDQHEYPIMLAPYGQSSTNTTSACFTDTITVNPRAGNITSPKFNGYTLAAASAKAVDSSITSTSSTNLPTTAAVAAYVASQMGDVAGALVYKGTVSAGSELLNTALSKGWYYIVDTAGSYAGSTCEPGDMIIVNTAGTYTTASALGAAVDIIQTNIDTISNSEIDTIVAS